MQSTTLQESKTSNKSEDTIADSSDEDARRRSRRRHQSRKFANSERRPQGKDLVDKVNQKLAECSVRTTFQSPVWMRRRYERRVFQDTSSPYRYSGRSSQNHSSLSEMSEAGFTKYDSGSDSPPRHSRQLNRMNPVSRQLYCRNKVEGGSRNLMSSPEEESRKLRSSHNKIRKRSSRRNLSELLPECRLRNIEATGGRRNFGKWFRTLPPNVRVDKDLRTDQGVFRKDNFQTAEALDRYLGIYS